MNFDLVRPCAHCPFRTDIPPYLNQERMQGICDSEGTFTCHETTVADEDSDDLDMKDGPNAQHCAGFLIMKEKEDRPNQMMRISERLGLYDRSKLDMSSPVFESSEDAINAQEER